MRHTTTKPEAASVLARAKLLRRLAVVALVVGALLTSSVAFAQQRHQPSMDEMAQSYCENAIAVARLNMSTDEFKDLVLADSEFREDYPSGWEQYRCFVDAYCFVPNKAERCYGDGQGGQICNTVNLGGGRWQPTSFSGNPDQVRQLRCQEGGWLRLN